MLFLVLLSFSFLYISAHGLVEPFKKKHTYQLIYSLFNTKVNSYKAIAFSSVHKI